jgi:hypothetical protein
VVVRWIRDQRERKRVLDDRRLKLQSNMMSLRIVGLKVMDAIDH